MRKLPFGFFSLLLILCCCRLMQGWIGEYDQAVRSSLGVYVTLAAFSFIAAIWILISQSYKKIQLTVWDLLPLGLLAVWLYGAFVGLLSGFQPLLVFRNFFGVVIFSFYYLILFSGISKKEASKTLILISALASIAIFVSMALRYPEYYRLSQIITARLLFSPIQLLAFAPVPLLIYLLVSKRQRNESLPWKNAWLICASFLGLVTLTTVVLMKSKGLFLSLIVTQLFLFSILLRHRIVYLAIVQYAFFLVLHAFPGNPLDSFYKLAFTIVSPNNPSNIERSLQALYLWDDSTFLGHGLGAALSNFYIRDSALVYSYEHSLLNLVHKFGVLSVVFFMAYLLPFWKILENLIRKNETVPSLLALGCMTPFFMGLGNPTLFSPEGVLLHSIALFLLRPEKSN